MNKPKTGTIKRLNYDHAFKTMIDNEFNMTQTAKVLGISLRCLRNWRNEMEKMGYDFKYRNALAIEAKEAREKKEIELKYTGFASNEERLRYRDNPHKRYYVDDSK